MNEATNPLAVPLLDLLRELRRVKLENQDNRAAYFAALHLLAERDREIRLLHERYARLAIEYRDYRARTLLAPDGRAA